MSNAPIIHSIKKSNGIAGQFQLTAVVEYEGEGKSSVGFVGSVYGSPGPVVMVTESGHQIMVKDPERCGSEFSEAWVRSFFAPKEG